MQRDFTQTEAFKEGQKGLQLFLEHEYKKCIDYFNKSNQLICNYLEEYLKENIYHIDEITSISIPDTLPDKYDFDCFRVLIVNCENLAQAYLSINEFDKSSAELKKSINYSLLFNDLFDSKDSLKEVVENLFIALVCSKEMNKNSDIYIYLTDYLKAIVDFAVNTNGEIKEFENDLEYALDTLVEFFKSEPEEANEIINLFYNCTVTLLKFHLIDIYMMFQVFAYPALTFYLANPDKEKWNIDISECEYTLVQYLFNCYLIFFMNNDQNGVEAFTNLFETIANDLTSPRAISLIVDVLTDRVVITSEQEDYAQAAAYLYDLIDYMERNSLNDFEILLRYERLLLCLAESNQIEKVEDIIKKILYILDTIKPEKFGLEEDEYQNLLKELKVKRIELFTNASIIYKDIKDTEKAIDYISKARALFDELEPTEIKDEQFYELLRFINNIENDLGI